MMTTEEKRNAINAFCEEQESCLKCPHAENGFCGGHFAGGAPPDVIDAWYDRFFSTEQSQESGIKDSGERREFSTGAVRDMAEGKGDMVSIPWESILRLSRHYEAGAKKYARWNFRKGIPVSSFIDSAMRHLAKYQCGEDDEDHLSAAAFNVLGAMLMENTMPEMQDLPAREGKKCFGYFEAQEEKAQCK